MDRGRRDDNGGRGSIHYPDRDRSRLDARDLIADRGQRDDRDRRDSGGWARGPRSGTNDDRGGAPRPSGGRHFETRYESQAFQHQPRSEAMAVHNSSVRRDEPERRYDEPSLRSDEPPSDGMTIPRFGATRLSDGMKSPGHR